MKILLIAIGTRGDVQPFVVAGKALIARGHDVSIAAAKGFAPMIAAAGLYHHVLPLDFQDLMQEPDIKAAMTTFMGKLKVYHQAGDLMNEHLDAVWAIGHEVVPDVILYHFKGVLGPYLARKLGVVSIPVMLQPGFMPTREYPQFMIASHSLGGIGNVASHQLILAVIRFGTAMMINRWRKTSNPDLGTSMDLSQGYNPKGQAFRVHAYSETIVPRPSEWPETERQTGYLFSEPEPFEPPTALRKFLSAGPPPVYVGFGSMPVIHPQRTLGAVQGALEANGLRAVIATGWGELEEWKSSGDMLVLEAVPHTWLFPQVAAVVHHGGSGTTHEGLRWGRPSVVCPIFADQPFFGQRVADLEAGPSPIVQKRLSADRLAIALDVALSEPIRNRAAKLGAKLRAEDGVARLCDLVEQSLH